MVIQRNFKFLGKQEPVSSLELQSAANLARNHWLRDHLAVSIRLDIRLAESDRFS